MISIVGGTYLEHCIEPFWEELYGSGLRAAGSIMDLTNQVTLYTYISPSRAKLLSSIASTFNVNLKTIEISQTVSFRYYHGLSAPLISPSLKTIQQNIAQSFNVKDINILRFGILEGDGIVDGEWVVYDPQDETSPAPFSKNGSKAKHLAIVANYNEMVKLSGKIQVDDIGIELINNQSAEVVVIKRGPIGATVITAQGINTVPVFQTSNVWPIGSGDVFSALFTHFWAEKNLDPITAARNASLGTAEYCNNTFLPIPKDTFKNSIYKPINIKLDKRAEPLKNPQIYLAGPFFTMAQRWLIEEAKRALSNINLTVFSPLHDVGPGIPSIVAPADLNALEKSDTVLAILDGLDTGTVFEVGYARAKNIPVILFVQGETSKDLLMLEGTDCTIISDFASAIYNTSWIAFSK